MPAHTSAPDITAAARAVGGSRATGAVGAHLSVDGLSHAYADRRVLSDISFTARAGDRIGLIGENGTGKSTLLRLLAGAGPGPDSGAVSLSGSVGLLAQELPYPDATPISRVLDDAQRGMIDLLDALERLGARLAQEPANPAIAERYSEALEAAERAGAWSAEARRGEIVTGLGLAGIAAEHPVGELSGGQRLRLSLAAILLEAPHTLLLDEPSNHLDDASAAYLERVLANWHGIVIVASHDRSLLDAVATRILDLDALPLPARVLDDAEAAAPASAGELGPFTAAGARSDPAPDTTDDTTDDPGAGFGARLWGVGYSAARAERQREMRRWRERYETESAEREALRHEIEVGSREVNRKHESKSEAKITRKFYADKDARVTARRARNARVRLEALERDRVRRPPEPLRFGGFGDGRSETAAQAASGPGHDPAPLLVAERVALAGRLRPVSLELHAGGRIMLTGPNGAGKSTLLELLAGGAAPSSGEVRRDARIGYLPQEVVFAAPRRSVERSYREAVGFERAEAVPLTATGLIAARDLDREVGALSVGQRRRLALAMLVADPPPVLLLDEPTNHLSLTLVEELEEALREFTGAAAAAGATDAAGQTGAPQPGALVIATHDRWLRSRWNGEVLPLEPAI